jgi:serine/threonine-protein kinase
MAQPIPTKLGRYEILKHLANGGMAQVLIARATGIEGFERHVVVKRIHSDRATDPLFVKMFLDEARLAAALHHSNIVQVHDIGKEDNGEYFFAMEYVHGEDLRKLLTHHSRRKEKIPFEHVVSIVASAASGLHHAHEQRATDGTPLGLVHRDVSPGNILVSYDGTVKVVDFGIAKAASSEGTNGGMLKGKVAYMAPEQCAGKPIDRRSDVYSLGIVLYELCTVRRLFKGNNDFVTMSAIVQGAIPHPSQQRPDIPPALAAIIMKALARLPADRFQTADAMRDALEQFADSLQLRTSPGALARYMNQVFGKRPEPWLIDDDEPEMEVTVDFDGPASGIVPGSEEAAENLRVPASLQPTPNAPIMHARKRSITDKIAAKLATSTAPVKASALPSPAAPRPPSPRATPPSIQAPQRASAPVEAPPAEPPALSVAMRDDDFREDEPSDDKTIAEPSKVSDGSGSWNKTPTETPFAFSSETPASVPAQRPRRTVMLVAGGVGTALVIVVVWFAMRGHGEPAERRAPATAPATVERAVEPPPPPVSIDAAAPEPEVAEPEVAEPAPAESVVAEPTPGSAAADPDRGSAAPPTLKKPPKQRKKWSPDELFIE